MATIEAEVFQSFRAKPQVDPEDDQLWHEVIERKGRTWGYQWRRNFGDKVLISVKSLMGKLHEEQFHLLAGTTYDRHYPEVFLGDALEFAMALKRIDERHREMAAIHYLIPQPAKVKAHEMEIHEQTYWQRRRSMRKALMKWIVV